MNDRGRRDSMEDEVSASQFSKIDISTDDDDEPPLGSVCSGITGTATRALRMMGFISGG